MPQPRATSTFCGSTFLHVAKHHAFIIPLLICSGHTMSVTCLLLLADGKTLVSGSADKSLRLWNTITGECLKVLAAAHESSVQVFQVTLANSTVLG